jgi:hypothetical protein
LIVAMCESETSEAIPVRKRSRPPLRHLPRALGVRSRETIDSLVLEIQQMLGFGHDLDTTLAALFHARNSV